MMHGEGPKVASRGNSFWRKSAPGKTEMEVVAGGAVGAKVIGGVTVSL